MATEIYLVRHGETEWNSSMRFQGGSDIELSEKGILQAQKLAERLQEVEFSAIYSSDLKRAHLTAAYVAEKQNLTVVKEPLLREISFGKWEGLTKEEIEKVWPGAVDNYFNDPDSFVPDGGESFSELLKRASSVFDNLCKKNPDQTILIVSHGGVIRTILADILQMRLKGSWHIRQDNTAVNIIGRYGDFYAVNLLNSTSHLKNLSANK